MPETLFGGGNTPKKDDPSHIIEQKIAALVVQHPTVVEVDSFRITPELLDIHEWWRPYGTT